MNVWHILHAKRLIIGGVAVAALGAGIVYAVAPGSPTEANHNTRPATVTHNATTSNPPKANTAPAANLAPTSQTTINTTGNCTKSQTTQDNSTSSNASRSENIDVHCQNDQNNGTSSVSVTDISNQHASSGSSQTSSGSASATNNSTIDITSN